MTRTLQHAAAAALVVLLSALVTAAPAIAEAPTPQPTSRTDVERRTVVYYDPKTGKLRYTLVAPSGDPAEVDVSDMRIDPACAFYYYWSPNGNIRISLLRQGCATLLPGKGTPEEQEAQQQAPKPSASASAGPAAAGQGETPSDTWPKVRTWLAGNWLDALGVVLAIGFGITGLGWYVSRRDRRKVRVLLAGAPSAGKSGLWRAMKDGTAPSGLRPSVGRSVPAKLDPIPFGTYTLYPAVTDTAGSEPWVVLDEMGIRRNRKRQKLVLVVVASPVSGDNRVSTPGDFDDAFIKRQEGYMSLPRGIIGSADKYRRPDLVVFFVSKFDLVSAVAPTDSTATGARQKVTAAFREHARLLDSVCRDKGVPYQFVIGSATEGWGIDTVTKKLQGVIKL
ncbi:GTPase domain-containing protein [Actinoplanes sp. NPDC049802]|uniref:GTPase domain-containing protein n=1 Tax=Actinoplanes sp. NPDC049802 TaxID=3154742 RepID=UPI0033C1A977